MRGRRDAAFTVSVSLIIINSLQRNAHDRKHKN